MPELSDQEYANLKAASDFMRKMAATDERAFEALAKKTDPKLVTTEDKLKPEREEIQKLHERFEKIEERFKKQTDDEADAKFFHAMDDLKSNRGLTDEGAEKLKQIMKEKIIPDPYVAFNHMQAIEPKTEAPSSFAPTSWGFGGKTDDESIKSLFSDEDSWAEKEARAAWNDAQRAK